MIKKAARDLQRTRADVALKQAQLENAVIEFQKREAQLAKGEAELVQQRRMLQHHRDNELRVRAAVSRNRAVTGDGSVAPGEFEMHSDPEEPTPRTRGRHGSVPRGTTPRRRRDHTPPATPRGTVRSPAALAATYFDSRRVGSVSATSSADGCAGDAVAQAEEMLQATEAMIERERAALRAESDAARRRNQAANEAAARQLDDAARAEAALRGVAQDLRLVLDSSRAAAAGLAIAPELTLLQRRVESALGISSPAASRAESRSPSRFVFDDDL